MASNFDRPFVNYFAQVLDESASVLAMEIFDGDRLVDVELVSPYRANPETCAQQAVTENKLAISRGDHVSQARPAAQKSVAA